MVSTAPLTATILFQINQGASPLTEVGIASSRPLSRFEVPVVFKRNTYNTGIAFLNPRDEEVSVTLKAINESGDILATQSVDMQAHQHDAKFADQFFAAIAALPEFEGSIEVMAEKPISAVALKQTGILLTAFPVAELK